MRKLIPFLLAFAIHATAFADKVSLTCDQAFYLQAALTQLDGQQKLTSDGKAVYLAYEFTGSTRLVIAQDMASLKPVLDPYNVAKQKILDSHNIQDPQKAAADPARKADLDKANAEWADATKAPIVIDLKKLTTSQLNLDTNPIPGSVITQLAPIISDFR